MIEAPTWEEINAQLARGPDELETFNRLDREMDWWAVEREGRDIYIRKGAWCLERGDGRVKTAFSLFVCVISLVFSLVFSLPPHSNRYDAEDDLPDWVQYRSSDVKEALAVCQKGPSKTGERGGCAAGGTGLVRRYSH